jgi:hypothetical protein
MFYRKMMYVSVLLLLLTMAGCAAFSSVGGGSPEGKKKAEMSKDDLWNRTKALENEKAAYQKRLSDQQVEIDRMAKDLSDQQTEIARAHNQVAELNKSLDELNTQMRQVREARPKEQPLEETDLVQPKQETVKEDKTVKAPKQVARGEPAEAKPSQQKTLMIKVLAGDGNLASAGSLSKRLDGMGYRVKLIDRAPRSDFDVTVVYYGKDHRAAAETMAKKLGGGTATKPLTWSSAFDIIIVTGRRP